MGNPVLLFDFLQTTAPYFVPDFDRARYVFVKLLRWLVTENVPSACAEILM
jgi:hypothetical protein